MRNEVSVRNWIHLTVLLGVLGLVSSGLTTVGSAAEADTRPNILVCMADDWSFPHAGIYGDKVVKTPAFDSLARNGVLFTGAFCAAPSCSPSRAATLTGQAPHRLESGANLWGSLPRKFPTYTFLLEKAGYHVGSTGKGWGPGNVQAGGWTHNPAGRPYKNFEAFLASVPPATPFCFWFGGADPHRPYQADTGVKSGLKIEDVAVPPYLPDTPEVRRDILDYYYEVQRFDSAVAKLLETLENSGKAANTMVVMSSDNGWPFPRSKANLYDAGTHMPLAIRWPQYAIKGLKVDALVTLADFAPTFLEAAGLKAPATMTGQNLLPTLRGIAQPNRDRVFIERERHANVRKGDLSYPARAVRTGQFLYILNLRPERWPAGDPEKWKDVGAFGDCDDSPSKQWLLANRSRPAVTPIFELAFGLRPAEELYDLEKDPAQLKNVAGDPAYALKKKQLDAMLRGWMRDTADPRERGSGDQFEKYPYYGGAARGPRAVVSR